MTVQTDFLERCKALNLHDGKLSDWLDEIESLRQQLAAAIAACKLKHSALETLWIGTNREEWDGVAIKSFEDALAIQPDDSALKAWLGGPVAWKDAEARNRIIFPPMKPEEGDDGWIPLYSPKGLK